VAAAGTFGAQVGVVPACNAPSQRIGNNCGTRCCFWTLGNVLLNHRGDTPIVRALVYPVRAGMPGFGVRMYWRIMPFLKTSLCRKTAYCCQSAV